MALMMGATAGMNAVAPSTASAEISDKFRFELNGVITHYFDKNNLSGYTQQAKDGQYKRSHWNNYTRLQMDYFVDKVTCLQLFSCLHEGFFLFG